MDLHLITIDPGKTGHVSGELQDEMERLQGP